MLLVALKQSSP